MSIRHEQWTSTTPKVPFSSVKSEQWVVQLHCDSLEVGGTAAPEITKPESFWSIHKTFPLFNNNNNKKDPPAPGWMPPTTHYHIFVLHDSALPPSILKEFKSSNTGSMLNVWNKSSTLQYCTHFWHYIK